MIIHSISRWADVAQIQADLEITFNYISGLANHLTVINNELLDKDAPAEHVEAHKKIILCAEKNKFFAV